MIALKSVKVVLICLVVTMKSHKIVHTILEHTQTSKNETHTHTQTHTQTHTNINKHTQSVFVRSEKP